MKKDDALNALEWAIERRVMDDPKGAPEVDDELVALTHLRNRIARDEGADLFY